MKKNMVFLCEMWKMAADEYMIFLTRHGIECFSVGILAKNSVAIYADQDKYLELSVNDNSFSGDEKHIIDLLELLERTIEEAAKIQSSEEQTDENQYPKEDED